MNKNLVSVKGISCWGAHTGIKSKRRDLAIVHSEVPANASAVFTKNIVVAETVKVAREQMKSGKVQTLIVNAGNANACTGKQGKEGALAMIDATSESLKVKKEHVFIASTGVIGREFPTEKVVEGIKVNAGKLSRRKVAGSLPANAITTTDTFTKEGHRSFKIDNKPVNIAGIAKGSGMIHPNMGTMLAFLVCDIAIDQKLLDRTFRKIVDDTFNMISVDGDTSTNDTAMIMCNGMAGNEEIKSETNKNFPPFKKALEDLCMHLAKLIVSDGEGATKLIEYTVNGVDTKENAKKIVRTVQDSSLVKTAVFGRDPNWGRIVAAAGRAGVDFNPDNVDLKIGTSTKKMVYVLKGSQPMNKNLTTLKKMMRASHIYIDLNINQGDETATGWGTDLTFEYVRFNSQYTT